MISNILKVAIMTLFFLFGFDIIPQAAEEMNTQPFAKIWGREEDYYKL
ncbi:MAG: hypothetical protein MSH47_01260 [Bacteroidales bacterium]|nr:hypothetical protein [Bacteroidales bacterium]MDY5194691.1 hypothetical protein [Candidatus Aphodosoma sp.]